MGFLKISAEDCALLATLFLASIGLRCNLAANIFRDIGGWRQGESSAHRADSLCHFLPDIAPGLLFARADEGRTPRTSRPCDHDPNGCDFCASPCHIVCVVNGPVGKAPVTARVALECGVASTRLLVWVALSWSRSRRGRRPVCADERSSACLRLADLLTVLGRLWGVPLLLHRFLNQGGKRG